MTQKKGKLFVISAPSGSGKTTLCDKIISMHEMNMARSVSMTTRAARLNEKDKIDYFFADKKEFRRLIKENGFLEWAKVFGNYYGTPRYFVEDNLKTGKNVLLNIDVQGALQVKKTMPESILIYIKPPSMEVLKERLIKRNTDAIKEINKRLKVAKDELKQILRYKYVIVNDSIAQAVGELKDIILAELKH